MVKARGTSQTYLLKRSRNTTHEDQEITAIVVTTFMCHIRRGKHSHTDRSVWLDQDGKNVEQNTNYNKTEHYRREILKKI